MASHNTAYLLKWTLILAVFWLLLSGFLKPLLLIFGAISVLLTLYVLNKMNQIDREKRILTFGPKKWRYVIWLFKEIVISSLSVTKLVWGKKSDIKPCLAKIPLDRVQKRRHVMYANSITLTPGTLSVDIDDKTITVHALQQESIDNLLSGNVAEHIAKSGGKLL